MILNEPETSLHTDLLPPLARLIAAASQACEMLVVTHSMDLANAISDHSNAKHIRLEKSFGETIISGNDEPLWKWPSR